MSTSSDGGASVDRDATRPAIDQMVTWVYTQDLPGTATFYAETLGLEMVLDQGSCRIYRTAAEAFLGVCHARPGRHVEPRGVVLTLVSDEVGDDERPISAERERWGGCP